MTAIISACNRATFEAQLPHIRAPRSRPPAKYALITGPNCPERDVDRAIEAFSSPEHNISVERIPYGDERLVPLRGNSSIIPLGASAGLRQAVHTLKPEHVADFTDVLVLLYFSHGEHEIFVQGWWGTEDNDEVLANGLNIE